jgi:hypothetical protein
MKKIFILLFVACFVAFPYGGDVGHGIEKNRHGDPKGWFTKPDRTIRYCVAGAEFFGVSEERLSQQIETAFETWHKYTLKKRITHFSDRFVRVECAAKPDITFYFGVKPAPLAEYFKKYNDPVAFAELTDFKDNWGTGFIWIKKPEEKSPYVYHKEEKQLHGLLLHELGHVYGNPHIEGTVMDTVAVDRLLSQKLNPGIEKLLTRIDWDRELAFPDDSKTQELKSNIGESAQTFAKVFKKVTGREPIGKKEIALVRRNSGISGWQKLTLRDEKGNNTFPLDSLGNSSKNENLITGSLYAHDHFPAGQTFSIKWEFGGGRAIGTHAGHTSHVAVIHVPVKNGQEFLPLIIDYNMAANWNVMADGKFEGFCAVRLSALFDGKQIVIGCFDTE